MAALKAGKTAGSFYCGRNLGKAVLPPNGTCSESGPHCQSCRACSLLGVKETKVASDCCLAAAKDGREGVVRAVKTASGAGARLVRVVSVHTGHVCYYAADDLMYADGSLPGPAPVIPMHDGKAGGGGPSKPAAAGNPQLPADWGAGYVASVEVSSDEMGNGPQVLVDGNGTTFWQSDGQGQETHFVQVRVGPPERTVSSWATKTLEPLGGSARTKLSFVFSPLYFREMRAGCRARTVCPGAAPPRPRLLTPQPTRCATHFGRQSEPPPPPPPRGAHR